MPVDLERVRAGDTNAILDDFHALHERAYGFSSPADECELVTMRLAASVEIDKPSLEARPEPVRDAAPASYGSPGVHARLRLRSHGDLRASHAGHRLSLRRACRRAPGRLDDTRTALRVTRRRRARKPRADHRGGRVVLLSIERVETIVVRLPPRADFRWLSLSRPLGEFVLVRIEGNGVEGWGEVVGLRDWGDADGRRHGETPGTISAIVHEYLAPALARAAVRPRRALRAPRRGRRGEPVCKGASRHRRTRPCGPRPRCSRVCPPRRARPSGSAGRAHAGTHARGRGARRGPGRGRGRRERAAGEGRAGCRS